MKTLIDVNLAKRLQVPTKHIQIKHVDGETIEIFKDLNITMDKSLLHRDFHAVDIDDVDIILGYPWMKSLVQEKENDYTEGYLSH